MYKGALLYEDRLPSTSHNTGYMSLKRHIALIVTKTNEKLCDKCLEEIYNTNFNIFDSDEILEIEATV